MRRTLLLVSGVMLLLSGCSEPASPVATEAIVEDAADGFREVVLQSDGDSPLPMRASASSETPGHEAFKAVDGAVGADSTWSCAGGEEQWIRLEFDRPATVERIVLVVSQPRSAETHHALWMKGQSGPGRLVAELQRETSDQQALEYVPLDPLTGVSSLRLVTLDTPFQAAWEEIMVYGSLEPLADEPAPPVDEVILFTNGVILTMDRDQPQAETLLVKGERIAFVGDEEEGREEAGEGALEIDLADRTLMPGFVDAHNHVFDSVYWGLDLDGLQEMVLANGITTMADAFVTEELLSTLMAMEEGGELQVRTSAYMVYGDYCGELLPMWFEAYPPERNPGDMLRWDAVKLFADGGVCGSPAYSFEHDRHGYGNLWFTQEQMNSMVEDIDSRGYQAIIHALGDRGADATLNAIEHVLDGGPNELRHRIEHNMFVRPDQYARYGELDVVAAFFGVYPNCVYDDITAPPAGKEDWEWPYTRILGANPGLHVAWHSDAPWIGPPDPIANLFSMVTDYEVAMDGETTCATPEWVTARDFTVEQALAMMTIEGAYALNRDDELGSLSAGKLADLVVLSADPSSIPVEDLLQIEVLLTMVGGETAYCGEPAVCP